MSAIATDPPTLPAPFSPDAVAGLCLHEPKYFKVQLQSTAHRAAILAHWNIPAGARVLEIGCGQGDTTAVLADLVGESGHVTGVDPGALDYGAPFTLGEAQAHLSAGRLGPRITWAHADPLAFLAARAPDAPPFDVAVLALCTWYFASPRVLAALLAALAPHATRLCVAEWSLGAARPAAHAHVLAALAQAALEHRNPASESNVRTAFAPASIVRAASAPGGGAWTVVSEGRFRPAEGTLDGQWEVQAVLGGEFERGIEEFVKEEGERAVVVALREAVRAAADVVGGPKKVEAMDVWCAEFVHA